jgi:sugar phosphate permease
MKKWQNKILLTSWITYASFYLIRVNMPVAIPGIMKEFQISKTEIGLVLSALFAAYAFGQFVNGQLGDKFGARKIVTLGLMVSAVLNIIFGFTGNFLLGMIIIWGLNGFFQSMGWGPIVKTVANWFQKDRRGRISGILASAYIAGSALSWLLAGYILKYGNWRWVFWVPAIITIGFAINWFRKIRNTCEDAGFPPVEICEDDNDKPKKPSILENSKFILKNKYIWLAAFSLFGLNIVRYGFIDWAPTYFFEVQKAEISRAVFKAIIFPAAGILGALFTGWASDKFFKSKRAPMATIMLLLLAVAALSFHLVPKENWLLSLVLLAITGFLTFGPHMLIVTALPMDLGTKERASSAAGFIDGMGYIGASLTGVGTGLLIDYINWDAAFYFWISGAIISAVFMLVLWGYERKRQKITQGELAN